MIKPPPRLSKKQIEQGAAEQAVAEQELQADKLFSEVLAHLDSEPPPTLCTFEKVVPPAVRNFLTERLEMKMHRVEWQEDLRSVSIT